jgi:hypothetical protein
MQKKLIRIMMGVGQTHTYQDLFKKLGILPIPCVYVLSLMVFVVSNLDMFQINNSMHMINTRISDHLHLRIMRLSPYQKCVHFSGVKLFNILPPKFQL